MSYTKFLCWGLLVALFGVFFVPFVIADGGSAWAQSPFTYIPWANSFFPYITGKNFLFRILVEAALFFYVLLALRDPKYRPTRSYMLFGLIAFGVWMGIADIFASVDPTKSVWSNFERMEGLVGLVHLVVYGIILASFMSAENLWRRYFNFSIGTSIAMGLYALFQVLHWFHLSPSSQSGVRADTTFGNAIYAAVFMLFNIFITLYLLPRAQKTWVKAVYGIALVLQFFTLYVTETRGAFYGTVGGIIVAAIWIAWRARERQWKALRRTALIGVVAIVIVAGGVFALRGTNFVKNNTTLNRFVSISLSDPTTSARLQYIWPMALKGALDKPVFGWGQENFSFVFNKYYAPQMYNQEAWFDRTHNEFLDWLIAGGAPALLIYLFFFAYSVWVIIRSSELNAPEQGVLLGLLAAYAFNNLTVFDNVMSSVYFFMFLAFIHTLSRERVPRSMALTKPVGDHGLAVFAPVVLVVVAIGSWALNAPGIARAQVLVDSITTQVPVQQNGVSVAGQRDPKENLAAFKVALGPVVWPGTPIGHQEAVEQAFSFASNQASATIDPAVKQDLYTTAHDAGATLLAERTHDARLEFFDAVFLTAFNNLTEAVPLYQAALADSPKKQQIMFQLGSTLLAAGDMPDALAQFKTAFEEDQTYDQARVLYAGALIQAGQQAAGDALLTARWGSPIADDDTLLRIYTGFKMWDRAEAIWKLRIQNSPNDPNIYLGLAQVYFAAGDKQDTIATLKKIEQIAPNYAGQMEQIITQINNGTLKPGQQ
ncbi:MAG: O-antigen ligase family protein [Patescibacteria group bacterium]|nr:O-antigen ligase family protein [Patescibacteria group bacterium]